MSAEFNKVTVDYITRSDETGDYSLYLLERAGWSELDARLKTLQERVYTALDVVLDGQLASDYPESRGKKVQIAVVFAGQDAPTAAVQMLERLDRVAKEDEEYGPSAISRGLIASVAVTAKITG